MWYKIFLVTFVESCSDKQYNHFMLWTIRANENETGLSKTILYFPLHFQIIISPISPLCRIIRDGKPIGRSNVAKSTITGPRIATNKSCYGNHCRTSMRLAFSSLRESSCWLPAVIQLLVRKHSQDARRQRAIVLKSLADGFVVRENVFRYLLFSPLFSPNVFSIWL